MDHADRGTCIGFDCHMTKQANVAQTTAASPDSPLLRARIPIVLDHVFTNWPILPTVDFLDEIHPAKFASPNTQLLLSN